MAIFFRGVHLFRTLILSTYPCWFSGMKPINFLGTGAYFPIIRVDQPSMVKSATEHSRDSLHGHMPPSLPKLHGHKKDSSNVKIKPKKLAAFKKEKLGTLGRVPEMYIYIYQHIPRIYRSYGLYNGCIGQFGVIFGKQLPSGTLQRVPKTSRSDPSSGWSDHTVDGKKSGIHQLIW